MTETEKKEICDKCDISYVCDYKSMPDCEDFKEKEIDEMAVIIENGSGEIATAVKTAKTLYNAGYRKQIWHKVADGDLPGTYSYVIVARKFGRSVGMLTSNNTWILFENTHYKYYPIDEVIAWAELPEYNKGE